jgi:hypothetical protein
VSKRPEEINLRNAEMEKSELARQILAYLVEHPDAQDTLDGIAQWWIPEEIIRSEIANTKKAIAELVSQKFIFELHGKDSKPLYRLNRRKIDQIKDFLAPKVSLTSEG